MGGKGKILALFDNIGRDYVSRVQSAAARSSQAAGYSLESENLFGTQRTFKDALAPGSFAGVVLTPPLSDDRRLLSHLETLHIPYVRIAPMLDFDRGTTVIIDEYDAARAITSTLIEAGHRRIAIMRGPREHLVSMRRYNGYAAAIGGAGQRMDPALVTTGDFSRESGRREAQTLLAAKPTAIFASNDEMAIGIIEAAQGQGLSVPGDLSVVGFDDNPAAKTCRPGLTTVRQPLEEMGSTAVELLVEKIASPARSARHATVPYEIIVRNSVAAPAS